MCVLSFCRAGVRRGGFRPFFRLPSGAGSSRSAVQKYKKLSGLRNNFRRFVILLTQTPCPLRFRTMRPEQGRALLAKCLVQRFLRVARLRCAEAGNFVLFYRRLRFFGLRAMCLYRRQASFFVRFFPVCHSERGDESCLCRLLSASHVLARPLFVILSGAKKLSPSPELRQVSGKSRATLRIP